jgi:opacity protein-like surface antigen
MRKLLTVISMTIIFSIPGLTVAAEPDDYINLKAGWFWPNSSSNGLKDFKQALVYEFDYGRNFGRNFSAELGGIYYQTEYDGTSSPENIAGKSSTDVNVSFYGPFATIKGTIHPVEKIDLFLGAGAGYYWSEIEMKASGKKDFKAKAKGIGWHIAAGSTFHVIERLGLGIEGKFTQAKLDSDDFTEKIDFGGISTSIYLKYLF